MAPFSNAYKKAIFSVLNLTVVLMSAAAFAQSAGTVEAAKQNPLPVYSSPNAPDPAARVLATGLPWAIKDVRNGFFLVTVGNKDVWVDSMDVRAQRAAVEHCMSAPGDTSIAGTPGAASKHCK